MIQTEHIQKLIQIYQNQKEIYQVIQGLARKFLDGLSGQTAAEGMLNYFQLRLSREKELSELDQSISLEKKLWQDYKDSLSDTDPLKLELKKLLAQIQPIIVATLQIDNSITEQVKKEGVQIRPTPATIENITQTQALNRYKQYKK